MDAKDMDDEAKAARRKQIEEQVAAAKLARAAEEEWVKVDTPGRLTREAIITLLNEVPVFVVANGDNDAVSMHDAVNESETIYWHTDPAEAKAQLEVVRSLNPNVAGLHLSGSRLGMAYSLGAGWSLASAHFSGAAQTGGDAYPTPKLRHEVVMESGTSEAMPVFLCSELQTPMMVPVFFDRTDLARAWIASGRTREGFNEQRNLTVMDLRMLVHQMTEEDRPAWSVVRFIPPSKAAAVLERASGRLAKAIDSGDEPPPLTTAPDLS